MATSKKSGLKKLLIAAGIFVGILVLFLASIPFWFDIDSYRPLLISQAQNHIQGKIQLGKLSLSVWGKIKIKVDGAELSDANHQKMISVQSASAEIPLQSIFNSKPSLAIRLENPEVFVVKDKNGKLNLLSLIPDSSKSNLKPSDEVTKETAKTTAYSTEKVALPAFLMASELNLILANAQFTYSDLARQQKTRLQDISIEMLNVSLTSPFEINAKAELNTRIGEMLAIKGPLQFKSKVNPQNRTGRFDFQMPGLDCDGKIKITSVDTMSGEVDLTSKRIDYGNWMTKAAGAVLITNLSGKIIFTPSVFNFSSVTFNVLGGAGSAVGRVNMGRTTPDYNFKLSIKGLELDQAAASQSELLKNMFKGKADFEISGRGQSFDPVIAKKEFVATGSLTINEAKFASIDLGQMVEKGLGESLVKVFEQVPLLKGKPISKMGPIDSEYEWVHGDFNIQNGVFKSPNLESKAKTKKGLDFKGATELKLDDCSLKAQWRIIDTFNLTRVRDISVEQGGIKVEHILAQGNNPVSFPIELQGPCGSPKVNYEAMTGELLKIALQNAGKGFTQKAKQEITKKITEELPKEVAKPIQDALKGIFGK